MKPTAGRRKRHRKVILQPLLLQLLAMWIGPVTTPAYALPLDAEEQANCDRVSRILEENSAPVNEALERLARQRFGRGFSELSPDQMMQLSLGANLEVRQLTASQQKMQDRCAASQQRQMAKDSAAGGLRSLATAQGYLDRWGREKIAGLGCSCADFRPAGEDVDHSCPSPPICPGQQGGPRIPDLKGGCRSIGAAAWILQQLPAFYQLLQFPMESEQVRDVMASLNRPLPSSGCSQRFEPSAPLLTAATLSSITHPPTPNGSALSAALAPAAACFASPTTATCQDALERGDALVAAARRSGRESCLGYALTARTLWALGADPRFIDLLISYPEASRLRNEARIALRYLRMDCRGL